MTRAPTLTLVATLALACARAEVQDRTDSPSPAETASSGQRPVPVRVGRGAQPVPVDDWETISSAGHRKGPSNARVTIVELSDFQCPYCRFFATRVMPGILRQFDGDVAWIFRHAPLETRPHAFRAARAAECAAEQGRFWELHDTLFAQQPAIGRKSFEDFAREAGVRDLDRFASCTSDTSHVPAIAADMAVAASLGRTGTPTVIVNGIRYPGTPDSGTLARVIGAELRR